MDRNLYILEFLILLLQISCSFCSPSRKLTAQFNPNCDIQKCLSPTSLNLVHIKAEGTEDALHYLWSSFPSPSLLMAQTSLNATLHVNWTLLDKSSSYLHLLKFAEMPKYIFLTTFNKLIEFNDTEGKAKLQDANVTQNYDWSEFEWDDANASISHQKDFIGVVFKTSSSPLFNNNSKSSISLELRVYQDFGHAPDVPMLFHSDTSSQVLLVLDKMPTSSPNSRFAVEISQSYPNATDYDKKFHHLTKYQTKNINDEYSPGVFKILSFQDQDEGFIFWKPVAYLTPAHAFTKSVDAHFYGMTYSAASHPSLGLGTEASFNISFGSEDDGFYVKDGYNAWTFMVGQGKIPQEKPTLLYYILFGVGFGLPGLALIAGGLYLIIHHYTRKEEDEELLTI